MSEKYIPLYRKYRPQKFADVIGQDNLVRALSNAINLNRIAHAFLFCGPRGTGKTSSARILAKSLNCKDGPTLEPCGICPSCLDIINGNPIDVIEIDAASNRSVEDTQNILDKIQYVPLNGRYKIYVIDEVHMLSNHAFNALLKTLEEPPDNVIFILATTEIHKVLETIISRCQRFDFRRITVKDIIVRLKTIAELEKIDIEDEALSAIAKNSAGGMRDALAFLDQIAVLNVHKKITQEDVNELLGKISIDILFDLTEFITAQNPQGAIELIDKVYNKGAEPLQVVTNLIQYFRDLLIIRNCANLKNVVDLTQLGENHIKKMKPQASKFENEQLIGLIDRLAFYSKEIKDTANRYLWLELAIIDLASFGSYASVRELSDRIEKLEKMLDGREFSQINNVEKPVSDILAVEKQTELVKPVKIEAVAEKTVESQIKPVGSIEKPVELTEKSTVEPQTPEPSLSAPVKPAQKISESAPSINLGEIWSGILQNIESMPSKIFYSTQAKPVELNKDKVIIAFGNDIFVQKAKDHDKGKPFKAACTKYFDVNDIIVEIKLKSELKKMPAISKEQIGAQKPVKVASAGAVALQIEPAAEVFEVLDSKEISNNNVQKIAKNQAQYDIEDHKTDQVKMIADLFDGKYLD